MKRLYDLKNKFQINPNLEVTILEKKHIGIKLELKCIFNYGDKMEHLFLDVELIPTFDGLYYKWDDPYMPAIQNDVEEYFKNYLK